MTTILEVKDVVTRFRMSEKTVHAVNGVSFSLDEREILCVVGESGCGKSVTMLSLLRLIPEPPGDIVRGKANFLGRNLFELTPSELREVRGAQIGIVFQDPMTSLNPVLPIGRQIAEVLVEHLGLSRSQVRSRTIELLERVGIPHAESRIDNYPHQFSGGMRQRVMIAMALACNPKILIADEPTTALDVTIQAQIVDLVKRLRRELGMAVIWITHDLALVASLAERVVVMYAGFIVEQAPVKELFKNPRHPYIIGLMQSVPGMDDVTGQPLASIAGAPPDMLRAPRGCPFAPRCSYVMDRCREENPELLPVARDHVAACWWDVEEGRPRDS